MPTLKNGKWRMPQDSSIRTWKNTSEFPDTWAKATVEWLCEFYGVPAVYITIWDAKKRRGSGRAFLTMNRVHLSISRRNYRRDWKYWNIYWDVPRTARSACEAFVFLAAHEIAHIHNGDARINLALLSLSRGFASIYDFGSAVIGYPLRCFGSNGFGLMLTSYLAMPFAIFFVVGAVGRLTSRLLQAAVARQREYLADAAALQFLRQAAPLVSALEKAGRCRVDKPNRPARQAAFMMFVSPFRDRFWLVRTHPRIERRIAAVRRMTPQPADR